MDNVTISYSSLKVTRNTFKLRADVGERKYVHYVAIFWKLGIKNTTKNAGIAHDGDDSYEDAESDADEGNGRGRVGRRAGRLFS